MADIDKIVQDMIDASLQPVKEQRHAIERTSPMGGLFIGVCMKCGRGGLTLRQANDECDNPSGMTDDEALIRAIKGPN